MAEIFMDFAVFSTLLQDIRSFKPCKQMCVKSCQKAVVSLPQGMGVSSWLKASSVLEVLSIIARCEWKSVRFVAGNTAIGVFKNDDPSDLYVDLKNLSELTKIQVCNVLLFTFSFIY